MRIADDAAPKPSVPQRFAQGRADYIPHDTMEEQMLRDPEAREFIQWERQHAKQTLGRRLRFMGAIEGLTKLMGGTFEFLPGTLDPEDDIIVDGMEQEPPPAPQRQRPAQRRRRSS